MLVCQDKKVLTKDLGGYGLKSICTHQGPSLGGPLLGTSPDSLGQGWLVALTV